MGAPGGTYVPSLKFNMVVFHFEEYDMSLSIFF